MKCLQGVFKLIERFAPSRDDRTVSDESLEGGIERARSAMLLALQQHCNETPQLLELRIGSATQLSDLWYLRPGLMNAIAADRGEQVAQNVLVEIAPLFRKICTDTNFTQRRGPFRLSSGSINP